MKVCKKDLRLSRDWLGDRWVDIKLKPNIASTIFAVNSSNTKLSVSPSITKDVDSVGVAISCQDAPVTEKSNELNIVAEEVNWINDNKPHSQERSTQVEETEMLGNCDNENNDDDKDDKESNDGDDNNDGDNDDRDMEVFETSGEDCKTVELMEVAV